MNTLHWYQMKIWRNPVINFSWIQTKDMRLKFIIVTKSVCLAKISQTYGYSLSQEQIIYIATDYGLDGPESNPGGDEIFPPIQTGLGAHPASCKMGTGSFPGVKCGRGVLLTIHPLLVPRSWKSRAIPLSILWATPDL